MPPRVDEVADAAHVADEVGAELPAQLVHVDADRVALDLLAPAVEAVLELRPRQHRARAWQQRLEHRELARREQHRHAVLADPPRGRVERHAAGREQRLGPAGVAAQHGADAGVELVELERLDQVVVGAGVEAGDPVAARVAGGEHDHRRRIVAGAGGAQHREPVGSDRRRRPARAAGRGRAAPGRSARSPACRRRRRRRAPSRRRSPRGAAPAAGSRRSCGRLRRGEGA